MTIRYEWVEFEEFPEFLEKELDGYAVRSIATAPSSWPGGPQSVLIELEGEKSGDRVKMTIRHSGEGCCGQTPALDSLHQEPINNSSVELVYTPVTDEEYRLFFVDKRLKTVTWEFAARRGSGCTDTGDQYAVEITKEATYA